MSTIKKTIENWSENDDSEQLTNFLSKLSLNTDIPDTTNSLKNLKDNSLKRYSNIKNDKNVDDKHILIEEESLCESDKKSVEKLYLPKEETTYISSKGNEPAISLKKDLNIEAFNNVNSDYSSDSTSDSDSDASGYLLTRGKEKTKKKTSGRKQYEKPKRSVNVAEINQHSLNFLSSGYIVQNNVDNFQSSQVQFGFSNSYFPFHPIDPIQSVDSANFTDCSSNSPFNVSSPESGYDTQSSEVLSPSPPIVLPISSTIIVDEDKKRQSLLDDVLELQEYSQRLETQNLEVHIPSIDGIDKNEFIQQAILYLKRSEDGSGSEINGSQHSLGVEDSENSRNENTDYIPLDSLLDDYQIESNLLSSSINTSVSESECIQSVSNALEVSHSSPAKPIKRSYYKLNYIIKDIAKHQVRFCESFDNTNYLIELGNILHEIRGKKQCIYIEQQTEHSKRTNLHSAVLSSNIERIYCLVEIQKIFFHSIQFEINFKDIFGKTALNYAEEQKLPLIVDYLKENLAVKSIYI